MVNILVSTYNGIDYFEEQLDSLINQTYQNIKILVRDDGSSDSKFIKQLQSIKHSKISVMYEKNIGTVGSFFRLLEVSDNEAEYYAFCDQDDVWLPEKINRAVSLLNDNNESPCLYCSDAYLVNKDLDSLNKNFMQDKTHFSLETVLINNSSLGCTCVINKKLRNLILSHLPNLKNIIMHDWWCAIIAAAFGKIIYDPTKTLLYRQHGNNQIGAGKNTNLKIIKKIFFRNYNTNLLPQIYEFCIFYKKTTDLDSCYESFFYSKNNFFSRFSYSLKFKRSQMLKTLIFRILFSLGYYKFIKEI